MSLGELAGSFSKRAQSTTLTSLRLESIICGRSGTDYRKTLLQILAVPGYGLYSAICGRASVVRRRNCVRPQNVAAITYGDSPACRSPPIVPRASSAGLGNREVPTGMPSRVAAPLIPSGRAVLRGTKEPEVSVRLNGFLKAVSGIARHLPQEQSSRCRMWQSAEAKSECRFRGLLRTNHGMPGRHGADCGLSSGISAGRGARRASNPCGRLRPMPRQADGDVASAGTNPSCGVRRGACRLPGWARRPSAKHSPAS